MIKLMVIINEYGNKIEVKLKKPKNIKATKREQIELDNFYNKITKDMWRM